MCTNKRAVEFRAGYRKQGSTSGGGECASKGGGTQRGCEMEPGELPQRAMAPAGAGRSGSCICRCGSRALTSQPANQPLRPGHSGRLPFQGEVAMQRVPAADRAGARRALVLSPAPPPARVARAVVAPKSPAPRAHGAHGRGGGRPPAARAPLYVHLHHHSAFFPFHLLLLLLGLEAGVIAAPRLPGARRERRRRGGRGSGRGVPRGRLPDALHLDLQAPLLAEAAWGGEAGAHGRAASHQPARVRRAGRGRPLGVPGLLRLHATGVHHRGHWRPARGCAAPRSALCASGAMFLSSRRPPPPAPRPRPPRGPASSRPPLWPASLWPRPASPIRRGALSGEARGSRPRGLRARPSAPESAFQVEPEPGRGRPRSIPGKAWEGRESLTRQPACRERAPGAVDACPTLR